MKSLEELNTLKEKVVALNRKLEELTKEELQQVFGGAGSEDNGRFGVECPYCHFVLDLHDIDYKKDCLHYLCGTHGKLTYFNRERRWAEGWL